MDQKTSQKTARIALFLIWLVLLLPIYTANALEIEFNPDVGVTVTQTTATIKWKTDINSTGTVKYGTTASDKEATTEEGMEHEAVLEELKSGTEYKYQIIAEAGEETARKPEIASQTLKFTTQSEADTTPPEAVKDLRVTEAAPWRIRFEWDIDAAKTPDVAYYRVYKDGEMIWDKHMAKYKTDEDLEKDKEYTYEVSAVDTSGNEGPKTSVKAKAAEPKTAIIVSDVKTEVLGTNVIITWLTNDNAHSRVKYSTNPLLLDKKAEESTFVKEHKVSITGLEPDKEYTFRAESCDSDGSCANSSAMTFKTTSKVELFLNVEDVDCRPETKKWFNANLITMKGKSAPGVNVTAYINGKEERTLTVAINGEFSFSGMRLDATKAENEVKIIADDRLGKKIECREMVMLDYRGPEVILDNATKNLKFSGKKDIRVGGNVTDENEITLYIYISSMDDTQGPLQVENLRNGSIEPNAVSIEWDAVKHPNKTQISESRPNYDQILDPYGTNPIGGGYGNPYGGGLGGAYSPYGQTYGAPAAGMTGAYGTPGYGTAPMVTGRAAFILESVFGNQMTGMQFLTGTSTESETYSYLIYRSDVSGGPIAEVMSPTLTFQDTNVSTATTYNYQVSAMDTAGNEGPRSAKLTVTTPPNGTVVPPRAKIVPKSPALKDTKKYMTTANKSVEFSEVINNLFDGRNNIKLVFEDVAGNKFEESFEVYVDSEVPKILWPTATDLQKWFSPAMTSEIKIDGQINKPIGEVWIYVNKNLQALNGTAMQPDKKVTVGPNGTWSADVELQTTVAATMMATFAGQPTTDAQYGAGQPYGGAPGQQPAYGQQGTYGQPGYGGAQQYQTGQYAQGQAGAYGQGQGTPTTVTLIAVDGLGRKSEPVTSQILYQPCAQGNYFQVEIKPGGNVINTRELLEGVAAYGFGYELKWQGGGMGHNVTVNRIDVRPATLGAKEASKYDSNWILGATPTFRQNNASKGFVLVNFRPQIPEGKTYFEREKNLSQHRKGECWKWAGCVRLMLQLDIQFRSPELAKQYAAQSSGAAGTFGASQAMQVPTSQRQCVELKIQLDERVDPSLIPKGLLQAAVVMINKTLMILDAIEKPLRYIAKITLGFCLLSFFSKFIIQAMRNYYCKYTSALGALSKGGGGIATLIKQGKMELLAKWDDGTEQGACTVEFADSDEAKETCKTCALWIQKEKWITDKWHLFCDRITCPPVPTLQHFIIQAYGTAKKPNPWRYVEEASARAARQCQKDVNLIKECICGMDPTSPTCKPGQRCGTDGKCADITPCVQNQFINEPFCRCTTVAGANAPNPQHLFCKRGQSCNDGQCRGTESTSLASVQTPGIRTAEIKCSQKSIGTSTYRCSITQTQWKKDHPDQKCEAANKCYPDKGLCTSELSAYYCVETAAELLGAVKGEEACYQWAADNKPGEKWSCGCLASKDAWTSSMCTEENNCTTQKCTGLKNNYYCCSVAAQRKKFGDQKCKDDNPGWSCQCRGTYAKPPGLWTSAECTKDGECKTEVCKLDYNDYFCCSDETKAKKAEFKGTTTTTGTSGQAGQSGSSSGSVPQTEASPQFQFPGSYIYTSQTAKGAQVALDCKPYSKTIGGTKSCYWRYADSAKQNPLVGSKVVIYTGKVWVATTSQGTTWGCQCTDYASALDIMNEKSNSKCSKNTAWCSSSDGRGDYCKYCGGTGGTGSAITDLDGESASLPVIEETEPSFNLITGMAMSDVTEAGAEAIAKGGMGNLITGMADPPKPAPATTPAQGQTTTSRTPAPKGAAPKSAQQATSTTSSGKPITTVARKEAPKLPKPRYDLVMPYEKGFYINPNWAMSKSDCQFADLGRSAIEEMYNFYTKGSAEEKKKCEKGHLYQPSCCPWEYMDAWQWGMMFQSEMKLSYCLSHPEAAECGTGTQITTGLTGICTPKGNAKRVQTVIVDGLKYKKDYPVGQRSKVNDDVAYMVDIDEKGTAQQVKRGYYSSSQVKGTIGTMDTEGRVAITTGTYLVPVDPNKDLAAHFPERDNADPSKDQDTFKEGMIEFGKDLCDEVNAKNIVGVGATGVSFVRMCGQYFAPGKQPTEVPKELEEQYRKIMYLLGEPTRQYLAQPAGNFIDSLLTLCLSAMISWMQHLRNFLRALQTCLLSIMLTGDGSAGQCRAIMSQYICDLLMKIISCIMNRMGAGGSGNRIGSGGIGGIFGAIHSASTGVIADANARYGNNNLFSTTFNAQNIAHDACIFMFTGEWPTDWKSLFEQAITMPINTTALVFPVTRRWQAYDANTGYAKYVYRIGYSISAGANIEFKLFLLASTRPNCPGNEPCDGSHDITGKRYTDLGRQLKLYIPHHQSGTCPTTGQLGQGKFCTDEVLYVHPQGLPLRYDQAGIEWRPFQVPTAGPSGRQVFQGTMVSPETVSGAALGDVREIGSPLPDAGCSFRISDLSYKCGIEVPKAGQAVIVKAEPVRPDNQNNPFEPGDSNVVRVLVSNELPKDATTCTGDCQYTKYLVIDKVMNHHNQKIYPAEAATVVGERINEAGLKEMIFMAADQWPNTKAMAGAAGEFKVKQEDFTRTTKQITAGRYIATITKYRKLLAATTSKKFDWTSAEVGTFLVNCEKGKTTGICTYEPGEVVIQGTKREWKGSGVEKNCDVVSGQIADTGLYSIKCAGIIIYFDNAQWKKYSATVPKGEEWAIILENKLPNTAAGLATLCDSSVKKWTVTLQLRGVREVSGSYRMTTGPIVDPESRKAQQVDVPIYVVCRGTGAGGAFGKTLDKLTFTTKVLSSHTEFNKTYGLWTEQDAYGLGVGESINVGQFKWLNTAKTAFQLTIDSQVAAGRAAVLNIDVGSIGLIPSEEITFYKGDKQLQKCAETLSVPPCIHFIGDVNTRKISLMLAPGDPDFRFEGFKQGSGISALAMTGDIILTKDTPDGKVQGKTVIGLRDVIKEHKDKNIKITLSNYLERPDGFSIDYKSEPTDFFDPFSLYIDLDAVGFKIPDKATVNMGGEELAVCEGKGISASAYIVAGDEQVPAVADSTSGEAMMGITGWETAAELAAKAAKAKKDAEDLAAKAKAAADAAKAATAKTPTKTTTPPKAPPAAEAKMGATLTGGQQHCYFIRKTDPKGLVIMTKGSITDSKSIVVGGLEKTETFALASFTEALNRKIVLDRKNPSKYGLSATGWADTDDHKITITIKSQNPMEMEIENSHDGTEPGQTMHFTVELGPAKLSTTDQTQVEFSGSKGKMPNCPAGTEAPAESCVKARSLERIVILLKKVPKSALRISGLRALAKGGAEDKCADKMPGAKCDDKGLGFEICYQPPEAEWGAKECMSLCRTEYIVKELDKIRTEKGAVTINDYKAVLGKGEDKFCLSGTKDKCGTAEFLVNKCPGSTDIRCCPDGSGVKYVPKKSGYGGYSGVSKSTTGPCGKAGCQQVIIGTIKYIKIDGKWFVESLANRIPCKTFNGKAGICSNGACNEQEVKIPCLKEGDKVYCQSQKPGTECVKSGKELLCQSVAGCTTDAECGSGAKCNKGVGFGAVIAVGPLGYGSASAGICVQAECSTDADCANKEKQHRVPFKCQNSFLTTAGNCIPRYGTCSQSKPCPRGYDCIDAYACKPNVQEQLRTSISGSLSAEDEVKVATIDN